MEWTRGPVIGRGSFATVSLATTATGDLFAVKSTELSRSSFLQREKYFLSQLSSPLVIKYMGFDVTQDIYNLFMEYAPGGTIADVIKRQGGSLDESMIRSYTRQILQGLDYLHLNQLVHCDIKGQNILVSKDGVKIGDLGCAKILVEEGGGGASSVFSGTPVFMAPEVARGEEQGFPADVWALGCTVIEMATGSNPWPELDDPVSALYRIGYSGDLPEFPRWLSEDAKDFLGKCLTRDAKERWTANQLLKHPFVVDNLEKVEEEFTRSSPTSILDQGFWDSLDMPEPSLDPTQISSFFDSPVERIRQLIEGTPLVAAGTCLPNWGDEVDWVTVRSSQIDGISEQKYDTDPDDIESTRTESFLFSNFIVEEELESSIRNEDFLFEYPVLDESSSYGSIRTDYVLPCEIVSVSRNLDFENKINESHLSFKFKLELFTVCFNFLYTHPFKEFH